MIHTGQHGEYQWLVSGSEIRGLADLVVRFHCGLRLCITAFDSGPLRLTREELEQGWTTQRAVAVSPPVDESLAIPHDQYDEWYLLENPSFAENDLEVFVNYGAFTLAPPTELCKAFDPTWEKSAWEWLAPVQERFWLQLERLNPGTYVAVGDNDVIVSRNHRFIEAVHEAAAPCLRPNGPRCDSPG